MKLVLEQDSLLWALKYAAETARVHPETDVVEVARIVEEAMDRREMFESFTDPSVKEIITTTTTTETMLDDTPETNERLPIIPLV